jgi:hypothetical protein
MDTRMGVLIVMYTNNKSVRACPYQCPGSYRFIICIHDNQRAHPCVHTSVQALTDLLFVYMTINTPIRVSIPVSRLLQIYYLYTWQSTRPSVCPYQCQGSNTDLLFVYMTINTPIRVSIPVSRLLQIYYLYTWQSTRPSVGPPQCQGSYRFIICIHDNQRAHPWVHLNVKKTLGGVLNGRVDCHVYK